MTKLKFFPSSNSCTSAANFGVLLNCAVHDLKVHIKEALTFCQRSFGLAIATVADYIL